MRGNYRAAMCSEVCTTLYVENVCACLCKKTIHNEVYAALMQSILFREKSLFCFAYHEASIFCTKTEVFASCKRKLCHVVPDTTMSCSI